VSTVRCDGLPSRSSSSATRRLRRRGSVRETGASFSSRLRISGQQAAIRRRRELGQIGAAPLAQTSSMSRISVRLSSRAGACRPPCVRRARATGLTRGRQRRLQRKTWRQRVGYPSELAAAASRRRRRRGGRFQRLRSRQMMARRFCSNRRGRGLTVGAPSCLEPRGGVYCL